MNYSPNLFDGDAKDFSADDDFADPTYASPKLRRIRNVKEQLDSIAENVRGVDASKLPSKIIFSPELYSDIKQSSDFHKSTTAKCVTCGRIIKGAGNVSSNFVTHLRIKHSSAYEIYESLKRSGANSCRTSQEEFDKKVLHVIVDLALPVSVVEKKSFKDLFDGSGLYVMSRQTAVKKLTTQFAKMISDIKLNLSSAKYFCTTADIWSANHRSFMGFTCHWINDGFQRKSVALACRRIHGAHTAENISAMVMDINSSFGLNSSNIIMTVTDNGSNFVKAFKEHGLKNNSDEVDDDSDSDAPAFENESFLQKHHRCSSHTLNLLASTDFIKILKTDQSLYIRHSITFQKCNNLWKKCKWPKSSEVIVDTLGSSLIVPVVTRWNSLYDAVVRLLRHRDSLGKLCDLLSLPHFSICDLNYLESYTVLMEPIARTLGFLQGEQNVSFGCLLPVLITLSNNLLKFKNKGELLHMSAIVAKMEDQLRKRFHIFFSLSSEADIAIAAAVLTPDVKMKWLKGLQKSSTDFSEDCIKSRVINLIDYFIQNGIISLKMENRKESEVSQRSTFFNFGNDDDDTECSNGLQIDTFNHKTMVANQFYAYLNDASTGVEIWEKYGLLKEAALLFNTPLTSSGPVERLFSFAGIINSPRRHSLTDFSFEKLVLLKANDHIYS